MRITVEDLEALKELSDELEENHIETEKQLYEDIGGFSFESFETWIVVEIFKQRKEILKFVNI